MKNASRLLIPVLLIAASAGVYLPTLNFGFVVDDPRQIEMARSRFTWDQAPGYFTSDVWDYVEREKSNYYRPVFLVWLLLNYQAFGLDHFWWHASTVALHTIATLLLYFLARRLTGDAVLAGIGALLFAVNPLHIESVAWVSGATEPLFAVLTFAAILCHVRGMGTELRERRWWRMASVTLFALDMFAKETAVIVPAILFAAEWVFSGEREKRMRRALASMIPYVQVIVVYLGMRILALGSLAPQVGRWPWRFMAYTLPSAAWFYLKQLAWPADLGMFPNVAGVWSPGMRNFVLPLLGCAIAGAVLVWLWRRGGPAAFFAALMILPLAPVLNIGGFAPTDFVHNRYLYVPSAGFCVLAAMALRRWTRGWAEAGIVAAVALVFAWMAIREARYWNTDQTLATRAAELAPGTAAATQYLTGMLVLSGQYAAAVPLIAEQIAKFPTHDDLVYTMAVCHYRLGQWQAATEDLRHDIEMAPKNPQAHLLLGMSFQQLGRMDEAEAEMRRALEIRPRASAQYRGYHATLAQLLEQKGDLRGAAEQLDAEIQENPEDTTTVNRLIELRRKMPN